MLHTQEAAPPRRKTEEALEAAKRIETPWKKHTHKDVLWSLIIAKGFTSCHDFEAAVGKTANFDRTRISEMNEFLNPLGFALVGYPERNMGNGQNHAIYYLLTLQDDLGLQF